MSDISSFWNIDEMQADWQENFGILTSDNDMHTAVLISLLPMGLRAQMTHMKGLIAGDGGAIWVTRKQSVHVCGCCGEKN
jgi:phage gp46-like protein